MDIKINKALLKKLGLQDYTHFAISFGEWAKQNAGNALTIKGMIAEKSFQHLLKAYLREKGVL